MERLTSVIATIILWFVVAHSADAHPNSMSSTRIDVHQSHVDITMRCQVESLGEVITDLDATDDGSITGNEIADKQNDIRSYILENYTVTPTPSTDGEEITPTLTSLTHHPPGTNTLIPELDGTVDIRLQIHTSQPATKLTITSTLFADTSPDHIDMLAVHWPSGGTGYFGLSTDEPIAVALPVAHTPFRSFLNLGFEHILSGWDHLAFLVALILTARSLYSIVGVATAFTVAHSITLAIAAMGLPNLHRHAEFIEAVIALSIAYVAAQNIVQPNLKRARWPEAFIFGLIHGLGFAGFLRRTLLHETDKLLALVSFNLGVELGQILVVAVLFAAAIIAFRPNADNRDQPLIPSRSRTAMSLIVAFLGLYWFVTRI